MGFLVGALPTIVLWSIDADKCRDAHCRLTGALALSGRVAVRFSAAGVPERNPVLPTL